MTSACWTAVNSWLPAVTVSHFLIRSLNCRKTTVHSGRLDWVDGGEGGSRQKVAAQNQQRSFSFSSWDSLTVRCQAGKDLGLIPLLLLSCFRSSGLWHCLTVLPHRPSPPPLPVPSVDRALKTNSLSISSWLLILMENGHHVYRRKWCIPGLTFVSAKRTFNAMKHGKETAYWFQHHTCASAYSLTLTVGAWVWLMYLWS